MQLSLSKFVQVTVVALIVTCGLILFDVSAQERGTTYDQNRYAYSYTSSVNDLMNSIRPDHSPSPLAILITIGLAFAIPPLPLIHSWLLAQVYRYAYQPGERRAWNGLARWITAIISICAFMVIALWYGEPRITFFRIWWVMALLCFVLGVGAALWIARARQFSRRFTMLLALASGLVSLLIPAGVLGVWVAWPVILTGVLGYVVSRYFNENRLEDEYATLTNWQIDSITLGGMTFTGLLLLTIVPAGLALFSRMQANDWLYLIFGVAVLVVFATTMSQMMRLHLRGAAGKKKAGGGTANGGYVWHWVKIPLVWGVLAAGLTFVVFYAQAFAYSIFTALARF
jgi:hypothetical protein